METFYRKGEVKPRYYNPENVFDEIHFITFTDRDIEPEKIRPVAGNAKVFIHALGTLSIWNALEKKQTILETVKKIQPDVIRAFTPALHGYYAAYAAKTLGIPFVLSIHGDFDRDARHFFWKTGQFKNWLQSTFMKMVSERYAISNADEVICAYAFPVPYAKKYGAKNATIIYNKVYREAFDTASPALQLDKPAVICVGRMIPEKNQICLIEAMRDLEAYLILIGDGPMREAWQKKAQEWGVQEKVKFIPSVPNARIPAYYASAQVFALPIRYGGVAIPVIEAMAAGLPVVVARPERDPKPEIAPDAGWVIDNTPASFAQAIRRLLDEPETRNELIERGKKVFDTINGHAMEKKEADLYRGLIQKGKTTKKAKVE